MGLVDALEAVRGWLLVGTPHHHLPQEILYLRGGHPACISGDPSEPMEDLPHDAKILKSLIAPARYSDGPTLFLICAADVPPRCTIHEQTPEGKCRVWPEAAERGVQQAEGIIYRRANTQN